jgi:hypothetical protein
MCIQFWLHSLTEGDYLIYQWLVAYCDCLDYYTMKFGRSNILPLSSGLLCLEDGSSMFL